MAPDVATYEPRDPSRTVLYPVIAQHLETFLASRDDDPDAKGLPAYVQREFYDYLRGWSIDRDTSRASQAPPTAAEAADRRCERQRA